MDGGGSLTKRRVKERREREQSRGEERRGRKERETCGKTAHEMASIQDCVPSLPYLRSMVEIRCQKLKVHT